MKATCVECGTATQGEGSSRYEYRAFRLKKSFYCPDCWRKHHSGSPVLIVFLALCLLVLGTYAVLLARQQPAGTFRPLLTLLLTLSLFALFLLLMILLHELGHALAAILVGWRLFKISLGFGDQIAAVRLGKVVFELNVPFFAGCVWTAPRSQRWVRARYFFIVLGGPLTNLAALALMIAADPQSAPWSGQLDGPATLGRLFAGANLLLLAFCLFPLRLKVPYAGTSVEQTDGFSLLTIPFWSRAQVDHFHAYFFELEGMECLTAGHFADAKRWFERGLEHYPDDINIRDGLAAACFSLGEVSAARGHWCTLLTHAELSDEALATIVNSIAWVNLQIGGAEMLDEADRFSQAALDAQPGLAHVKGTRGSVLIELGRIDEGVALVREAFAGNADNGLKALNACFLALAAAKRGHHEESRDYLDLARRLDAECPLLPTMVQKIDSLSPHQDLS
jgi:tetratricopeptide (TPR) repeat protein